MSNLSDAITAFQSQNYQKALLLLEHLVQEDHANAEAYCLLANLYHLGLGVERDLKKAMNLYEKAVILGDAIAANNLAGIYRSGDAEIDRDVDLAEKFLSQAKSLGFPHTPISASVRG